MFFFKRKRRKYVETEIEPDEIFLDSSNLPEFNKNQFEGRIEKAITKGSFVFLSIVFILILSTFSFRAWSLQITQGAEFAERSENNRMRHDVVFADRGVIYDRNKNILVWNEIANEDKTDFSLRKYMQVDGLGHILGYVKYPAKDNSGFYYRTEFEGMDGAEKYFDEILSGTNGLKLTETDAFGKTQSESVLEKPTSGKSLHLTIDYRLQEKFYEFIKNLSQNVGFTGGAGVIMEVNTGEILSIVSFPEYKSQIMTDGEDKSEISRYNRSNNKPFLDRVIMGAYTPGSIVKPFVALGALNENVIDPLKNIYSSGSISVPNPYDPKRPSVFKDWKVHGYVDMRRAIAVSSDVYFYEIGGGFEDQIGMGITNIKKYMELFGFGSGIKKSFFTGIDGVVPDPEWKKENFSGDDWRIGDTYNTSIGQYGFQVSPIQVVRAVGAIANGGKLLKPYIALEERSDDSDTTELSFTEKQYKIVREGMRMAVTEGTAKGLDIPQVEIAAKTGTAEVGSLKRYVNSWIVGFYPYKNPKYAFTVIMEKGPYDNTIGGLYVMRQMIEWMSVYTPEYVL